MLGDKCAYNIWVSHPKQPNTVADMGLRLQPNIEYLYRTQPEMFLQTPFYASITPQLARIAPVHNIEIATAQGTTWAQTKP
ncbi:hypothetical protein QDY71_03560 [Kingella negevensis]|uniref:Iron(3+)-hydroxamate-binding protein FhuD n=1 Tax=Kingella negevensis TaxID=1522312 RepID=A0A238HHY7_9NEIS|nr:hypothetical protein [Kingella negevensis]MDK4679695.1 hypothetical protein [Kingella negevensis]MDK4682586.1 hypothetical protein [Kingella negevensis]MDK4684131.1 hypothetical protein [Kingella negevensis]MDK4690783.1 hypothetical protein [Kingella negevensis]MDK4694069.1 hypothetical protein [Kingella negevensis]